MSRLEVFAFKYPNETRPTFRAAFPVWVGLIRRTGRRYPVGIYLRLRSHAWGVVTL